MLQYTVLRTVGAASLLALSQIKNIKSLRATSAAVLCILSYHRMHGSRSLPKRGFCFCFFCVSFGFAMWRPLHVRAYKYICVYTGTAVYMHTPSVRGDCSIFPKARSLHLTYSTTISVGTTAVAVTGCAHVEHEHHSSVQQTIYGAYVQQQQT